MCRFLRSLPVMAVIFVMLCLPFTQTFADEVRPQIQFTPEEESFIASHDVLKIGYVQDRIPVSFSDENGELAGISRYIFDHVSKLTGLKFEYVALPEGDVTYDYLSGEGFDLVSSVEYNKENQKARGILISNPYLSDHKVIVARKGLEFSYDANLSIAISTGSQTLRKVLSAAYPNFDLVDYPSITACFDAVNSGEADLMIQNQHVVEHWISKPIYEKLKIIPVLGLDDQLCFSAVVAFGDAEGTSESDGRTLINILNKAIACTTEDEVGMYTIQASMDNQYRYTLSDFMYRYRYAVRVFILSLLIIIFLTLLLIRVHIRYTENKADAKVKNRFLSAMSHEIRTPLNGLIGLNYIMSQKLDNKEELEEYLRRSSMTANYLLSLVNDMLDMSNLQTQNLELNIRPADLELVTGTVNAIAENAMTEKGIDYKADIRISSKCVMGDEVRIQQVLLNLLDNARKFTPKGGSVRFSVNQETTADGKILTTAVVSDTGRGISEEFQKHIFDAFAQERDTIVKGAVEFVLPLCSRFFNGQKSVPISGAAKRKILAENDKMTSSALRVIAVAYKTGADSKNPTESNLIFVGLLGMQDPPRPEIAEAVRICRRARIRPVMITGDHAETAFAIARQTGIAQLKSEVMTGAELDSMSDDALKKCIGGYSVFARVTPSHKVRIVKALQSDGEITAMTGDGVNDAPALSAADIGCGMGSGTDAAKSASDMILTDDNFATIVYAVKEGRGIFVNIKKAVQFLLSSNIGEILTVFSGIVFGWSSPLTAIQLLWVNLVTDSLPAIALGLDPCGDDIMQKPPRSPKKSMFADGLWAAIIIEGLMVGALALLAFSIGANVFGDITVGRTMSFAVLSLCQLVHAFNMRSEGSVLGAELFKNPYLLLSLAIGAVMEIAVIMLPPLAKVFNVVSLGCVQWAIVAALSVMPLIIVEIQKFVTSLFKK